MKILIYLTLFSIFITSAFATECEEGKHVVRNQQSTEYFCSPKPVCNKNTQILNCYNTDYGESCACTPKNAGEDIVCKDHESLYNYSTHYGCGEKPSCNEKTQVRECSKYFKAEICQCLPKKKMKKNKDKDKDNDESNKKVDLPHNHSKKTCSSSCCADYMKSCISKDSKNKKLNCANLPKVCEDDPEYQCNYNGVCPKPDSSTCDISKKEWKKKCMYKLDIRCIKAPCPEPSEILVPSRYCQSTYNSCHTGTNKTLSYKGCEQIGDYKRDSISGKKAKKSKFNMDNILGPKKCDSESEKVICRGEMYCKDTKKLYDVSCLSNNKGVCLPIRECAGDQKVKPYLDKIFNINNQQSLDAHGTSTYYE